MHGLNSLTVIPETWNISKEISKEFLRSKHMKDSEELTDYDIVIDTQSAFFWGNPLHQATKQHLNNNNNNNVHLSCAYQSHNETTVKRLKMRWLIFCLLFIAWILFCSLTKGLPQICADCVSVTINTNMCRLCVCHNKYKYVQTVCLSQ